MPTYITLAEYSQLGIENIEDSLEWIDEMRDNADDWDGELHDVYVTFGEYDVVILSEFPDDESYAQFVLSVGSAGGFGTETLRAFTEDEYDNIIAGLIGPFGGPHGHG